MEKRDPLLYGVIGALIGGVVVWFLAISAVNNNQTSMMQMMGMHTPQNAMMKNNDTDADEDMNGMHGMGMSMDDMIESLDNKTGDDFDKTFLTEMIDHHQGAINMAKASQKNAKHQEIKNLAQDIISAQTKEIEEMKQWQKDWGYRN